MINKTKILAVLNSKIKDVFGAKIIDADQAENIADELLDTPFTPKPKWIDFARVGESPSGKTHIYQVRTKDDSPVLLGEIKWFPTFRTYAFYPQGNTIYEPQCLNDIILFIEALMFLRKKGMPSNSTEIIVQNNQEMEDHEL